MKITISGIRGNKDSQIIKSYNRLTEQSTKKIEDKIISLIYDDKIEELIFGGAMGSDNLALSIALIHKNHCFEDYDSIITPVKITVILPFTIEKQPRECRYNISQADEIIELKGVAKAVGTWVSYGSWVSSYFHRNEEMVKRCDKLVAFWDGFSGGTANTIGIAKKLKKDIEIIWVEASG